MRQPTETEIMVLEDFNLKPEDTTCAGCQENETCSMAFDPANLDGNCLMEQ